MSRLPPWSMRKITDCGPQPGPQGGDILRFEPSGRMYQVMKRRGKTQHCMVLPDNFDVTKEPPDTKVWSCQWVSTGRRRNHG